MDSLKHKAKSLQTSTSRKHVLHKALDLDIFYQHLCSFTSQHNNRYLIAYSGGLDSHVLLHLLSRLQNQYRTLQLRSIYIDHGLQAPSKQWAIHCEQVATSLNIPHHTITLALKPKKGESTEAVARTARYQAFAQYLQPEEVLLTAQHQDDQAETVLLQLMRGAGLDGLAAMPECADFADGYHMRPLLHTPQKVLEQYAQQHQLSFITDPSNADTRFDRNYLRHCVTPMIKQRWSEMSKTLSRVARFQAEASQLLAEYTSKELIHYQGKPTGTLAIDALKTTSLLKQKALLRAWIKNSGFPAPSEVKLQHIISDVIQAAVGTQPLVHWSQTEVRRYRNALYIMPTLPPLRSHTIIHWHDINQPLELDNQLGTLLPSDLGALKSVLLAHQMTVTVRFRQGGEKIRPDNKTYHLSLKNILQQAGIPPWQRPRIPLIYANEQLIQVLGLARVSRHALQIQPKTGILHNR